MRRDVTPVTLQYERVTLGPFEVSADPATVASFASATRGRSDGVPTTFPIVWLAHPAIRAAIEECAHPGEVAFHEEQLFDYRANLDCGGSYRLTAEVERQETPTRVAVSSEVERAGETILTMRTLLRLVSTPSATKAPMPGADQQ